MTQDPRLVLVCLALLRDPGDLTFRQLRKVYDPKPAALGLSIDFLREHRLVEGDEAQLTADGMKFLRQKVSAELLRRQAPTASVYRAFVSATLLGVAVSPSSFKVLADGRCICAALAARQLRPKLELPLDSVNALISFAARAVITSFLARVTGGEHWSEPITQGVKKDPLLMDLFQAATGHRELDAGFRAVAAKAINASSIPKTDGRWRRISQAGFDSMAPSPLQKKGTDADTDAVIGVVSRLVQSSPTGWVQIFTAFEAFRELRRTSLAQFKSVVEAAARADKLELAPLNVPSLLGENERAQSALVMGGLTYHLVRLPK